MQYKELVDVYEDLEKTTKRLEKTKIISDFLERCPANELREIIYLIQGRVFPAWDERDTGMSSMLVIKVLTEVTGLSKQKIEVVWRKKGDLGLVAEEIISKNKQSKLTSITLTVQHVFENIRKLAEMTGAGTVKRKVHLVSELVGNASPREAKFVVKTILDELRVGIASGTIRDAIIWAFLPKVIGINTGMKFKEAIKGKYKKVLKVKDVKDIKDTKKYYFIRADDEKTARGVYNYFVDLTQEAYDLSSDFGEISEKLKREGLLGFSGTGINVGIPVKPMLAIKVDNADEAFESVGSPLLAEHKLDGCRLQMHKKDNKIMLFTRGMENVTKQFNELVDLIKAQIKGKSFIVDSEVVGYDPKTKKYLPFQFISQRIKRKHKIESKAKEVPVEINVFDIMYYNGKSVMGLSQKERRKLLEKIVKEKAWKLVLTKKIITKDKGKLNQFYKESLEKGHEGLILKNIEKVYIPGRKVGGWVKLKPTLENLDLVIVKATYGEGKRTHLFSSFTLACKDDGKFLECGKMGTGIKEKGGGITFKELTKLLKPLIISEKGRTVEIKPKTIVEVSYEEIQKSPTYNSGYALRFPRLIRLRDDKSVKDAASIDSVRNIYKKQKKVHSL